jgi:hypothetical protein
VNSTALRLFQGLAGGLGLVSGGPPYLFFLLGLLQFLLCVFLFCRWPCLFSPWLQLLASGGAASFFVTSPDAAVPPEPVGLTLSRSPCAWSAATRAFCLACSRSACFDFSLSCAFTHFLSPRLLFCALPPATGQRVSLITASLERLQHLVEREATDLLARRKLLECSEKLRDVFLRRHQ